MAKSNGKPERCRQCTLILGQINQFCGFMHGEQDYYVLDCEGCGKTIVDRTGRCCAANCSENHGGRWHLTFAKKDVLLKVYDPKTGQSLVDKNGPG